MGREVARTHRPSRHSKSLAVIHDPQTLTIRTLIHNQTRMDIAHHAHLRCLSLRPYPPKLCHPERSEATAERNEGPAFVRALPKTWRRTSIPRK